MKLQTPEYYINYVNNDLGISNHCDAQLSFSKNEFVMFVVVWNIEYNKPIFNFVSSSHEEIINRLNDYFPNEFLNYDRGTKIKETLDGPDIELV
jgi:hypothetical protein